ncbi:Methylase involved in ubiquinone/menaquinone biosynthesis [Paramicrosporidium saccamoebae]|uniref:Methylase involved in ubiquinone/menaquinone biosynthesis n=1 Tax=Paramicrosporidium saccamoebae TaxID=1246581 RepID=A0A2H9TPI2_9FUNG|nr:Methylase involved in ubiquinone/menaquinone biosynthesis [Paramicrosporidium saccamoebae]
MEERRKVTTTQLYNRILECEERFDRLSFDLLASMRSGDHGRVQWLEARYLLKLLHEELLTADVEFVAKSQLLEPLWRRLYYGVVEQARRAEDEQVGLEVLALIDEGLGFFMILCYRLQKALDAFKDDMPLFIRTISKKKVVPVDLVNGLIYESLVYMGDLMRYRHGSVSTQQADLSLAEGQYKRAAKLLPDLGHAYNQLAVLCCIQDEVLHAITYYLRAAMSVTPFPKSTDNLLAICRRVVNIPEERLALSEDPAMAAFFGLLARLMAAVIVHDTTRNTQSVHLESITSGLAKLLPRLQFDLKPKELDVLHHLLMGMILSVEFLQHQSDDGRSRYLSASQMRLVLWIICCCEKFLLTKMISIVSPVCLWFTRSDIIKRILSTDAVTIPFDEAWSRFLRVLAESRAELGDLSVSCTNELLLGTRPFGHFELESPQDCIKKAIKVLADEHFLLIYDPDADSYYLREETSRKDLLGTRLAKQKLTREVLSLQSSIPKEVLFESTWHLVDAETLLKFWNLIEPRLEARSFRLIITLAVLRFLDVAKADPGHMIVARQIMRCIASFSKKIDSPVHLQHPSEISETALPALAKHHKALLSAYYFYKQPRGLKPLVILSNDPLLDGILSKLNVDHVSNQYELSLLAVAIERGLIKALSEGPKSRDDITAVGIFGPRAYDAIVPALICDGYLIRIDGKLYLTVGSPYSWETVINCFAVEPTAILHKIDNEIHGEDRNASKVPRNWRINGPSDCEAANFASLMNSKSAAPAEAFATIDFRTLFGTRRLLDIGGGAGTYSDRIAAKHDIQCTVLEMSAMARCVPQYCNSRVEVVTGDALQSLPTGYDTHLLCDTLHMFDRNDALAILRNCYSALPAGGVLLISSSMLDDGGCSPRNSVYFYVHMFVTGAGSRYTPTEFRELLSEAGFGEIQFQPYYAHYMLGHERQVSLECQQNASILERVRGKVGDEYTVLETDKTIVASLEETLDVYFSIAEKGHVTVFKLESGDDCILPRMIPGANNDTRQIIVFATDNPDGLRLYQTNFGDELLPIVVPDARILTVEPQAAMTEIYFSFSGKPSLLVVGVFSVTASKAAAPLDTLFVIEGEGPNEAFLDDSFVDLPCFLPPIADELLSELVAANSVHVGPFDYRCYELVALQALPKLQHAVLSDSFRDHIASLTGLTLVGISSLELRRITPGSYQLLNDEYTEPAGLDVVMTLGEGEGAVHYLVDGEQVAEVKALHNRMALAYRVEGCTRFMSYVSQRAESTYYQLVVTFKVKE